MITLGNPFHLEKALTLQSAANSPKGAEVNSVIRQSTEEDNFTEKTESHINSPIANSHVIFNNKAVYSPGPERLNQRSSTDLLV